MTPQIFHATKKTESSNHDTSNKPILSEKHALIALAITQQLKPTTWILRNQQKIEHITHAIYRFPEELDVFFCVCPFGKWKTGWWYTYPSENISSSMGRIIPYEMESKSPV